MAALCPVVSSIFYHVGQLAHILVSEALHLERKGKKRRGRGTEGMGLLHKTRCKLWGKTNACNTTILRGIGREIRTIL